MQLCYMFDLSSYWLVDYGDDGLQKFWNIELDVWNSAEIRTTRQN